MAVREGGPPAGEVRRQAHEILSRPEFGRHESLVQRVVEWIGDQLSRFTFGIGGGPGFVGDTSRTRLSVIGCPFVLTDSLFAPVTRS